MLLQQNSYYRLSTVLINPREIKHQILYLSHTYFMLQVIKYLNIFVIASHNTHFTTLLYIILYHRHLQHLVFQCFCCCYPIVINTMAQQRHCMTEGGGTPPFLFYKLTSSYSQVRYIFFNRQTKLLTLFIIMIIFTHIKLNKCHENIRYHTKHISSPYSTNSPIYRRIHGTK